jgi:hypothetical protein
LRGGSGPPAREVASELDDRRQKGETQSHPECRLAAKEPRRAARFEDRDPHHGCDLVARDEELIEVTMAVARGEISAEALALWLRQRVQNREP